MFEMCVALCAPHRSPSGGFWIRAFWWSIQLLTCIDVERSLSLQP